jgi:hypothetical protein
MLEQEPPFIIERPVQGPAQQRIPHPKVEQEQLWVGDKTFPVGSAPCWDPEYDQSIFQYIDISPGGFVTQSSVAAQRIEIEDFPGRSGDQLQQAPIPADIPNQGFCVNFFAQIGVRVAAQIRFTSSRVWFGIDAR